MLITSLLHDLFIAPLAVAYGAAYAVCSRLLGHGYGLLALSLLTTVLLVPLRRKVAAAQEEERLLRRVIEPQLARIKAESSGEERHTRIRRLYRRYAYHPVMSIRAMWGLLLQVPFILAAYHMLSGLSALRYVSFWGIASLAAPDALLGGVNLLPLLMTAFNLAAAFLTPGATRRETGQAIVIAALFLALLYHAPSALLIYWTANNFLSLVEVLVERRQRTAMPAAEDVVVDDIAASGATPGDIGRIGNTYSTVSLVGYAFACATLPVLWIYLLRWRVEDAYSGPSPYYFIFTWVELLLAGALLCGAAAGACRIAARRRLGLSVGRWNIAGTFFCIVSAIGIACGWAFSIRLRTISGKLFIWTTLAYAVCAFVAWFMAAGGLTPALVRFIRREAERSGRTLFWPAALALAGLLTMFAPMASYESAPEIFQHTAGHLFRALVPFFLCVVYCFLYLRVVLPPRILGLVGLVAAYAAVACLVMALAFPPVGIVDGNAFQPDAPPPRWVPLLQDGLGLTAALAILCLLARRRAMRFAAYGLATCAAAFIVFGAYIAASAPEGDAPVQRSASSSVALAGNHPVGEARELESQDLPAYHHRLFSFSRTGRNVLVFMFDMFHGGDIGRMLDDDPALRERLPGFVWYRDTIADGNCTMLSFPAILGGPDYTPEAINKRNNAKLADRIVASTAEMPRRFLEAGYDVAFHNVRQNLAVRTDKVLADYVGYSGDRLVEAAISPVYAELARQAINPDGAAAESNQTLYLLSVSLFRAVPNALRDSLLDLGLFDTDDHESKIYVETSMPLLMPRFMTTDSDAPTFKMFANMLSHNPFLLGPDSLVPLPRAERLAVARSGNAHYFTERHIIRLMIGIADRLRELGIYDNTRLIFASDHDNKDDAHPYLDGKTNRMDYIAKPHALLMVKDFGESDPLRVSDQLMQGHDVPALACLGLPANVAPPPLPADDPRRPRRHVIGHANLLYHGDKAFQNLSAFSIDGPMFSPSSWSRAEKSE